MFERLADLAAEHAQLEKDLADPAIHADPDRARTLSRRYGALTPIVQAYGEWLQTSQDEATAREFAPEDASFAAEAQQFAEHREELEQRLNALLVPRDPNDDKDVILEVKAGEGGEESPCSGDLLRMYLRFAERKGWKTEVLDSTMTGLGGYKDATVAVKAKGDEGAWSRLKYEGGVHRVQRVPATESQGRIHTSAAGVLVMPEADPVEVNIDPNDLKIDVFRSSGPGGQSVNTTDSAVRITHCRPESWFPVRTRRASCRTRSRRCGCFARGCSRSRRRKPTPRPRRSGAARWPLWTGRSGLGPTTSRRTGSPITGSDSRLTTLTRSSTATSTP